MTENEAIEFLKGKYPSWGCDEDEYENAITAIQALEEIQQYRAIGTVEEFKALKEKTIAEKPLIVPIDDTCLHQEYRCPSCNEWLADILKPYRCKCGKLLDWQ